MSFINSTLLNELQGTNLTSEMRFSQLGYVDLAADSTPFVDYILPEQIQAMNTLSSLRDQKFPIIKDMEVTVVETPGFNYIPSNQEESDKYGFSAVDVFSGFRHYPAAYANNMVGGKQAAMIKLNKICYEMGKIVESKISTIMEARKTQVLPYGTTEVSQGDGTFTFSTVTDTLSVSKAAQKETMFFNLTSLLEANEMPGQYRIVTQRAGLAVQKAEQLKYSVANDKNLAALGMFPLSNMYESGNLTVGNDDVFTGFVVRDGAIGLVENFPYDFVNGTEIGGMKWSISDMELPYCRMRGNIYTNKEAVNGSALITSGNDTNLTMTHFEEMGIWLRFYIVYRYNSNLAGKANDIVKIVGTKA